MRSGLFLVVGVICIGILGHSSSWKMHDDSPRPIFNHLTVYVKDLKVSSDFYEKIIGLEKMPEPFHDGRHTWFHTGGPGQLHVVSGNTEMDKHNINVHLAFSVKSLPDFITHLKSEKIKFGNWAQTSETPEVRPDGINQIYLQDPDGYWIEVNNDK
jgi:lactoylglutathione lyase